MDAGGTTSRVFMTTEQVTRSERLPYTALLVHMKINSEYNARVTVSPPEDGRAAAEVSPARLGLLGDALAPVLRGEPKPALHVPMEVEPVVQRERVFAKLLLRVVPYERTSGWS